MGIVTHSSLRIVSYNIRKARGLDQRRDPGRVLDVINAIEGDIVVLQEADRRLGQRKAALPRRMVEEHSDYTVASVARNDVSLGWHGNAVLVKDGIEISNITHIDLPGIEPRGAVRVDITGRARFSLVAAHLGLRRKDRRAQQIAITDALDPDGAAIVAGDFNEWSETKGLEGFADRFDLCAPGRSFHASRPVAALDRFGLSNRIDLHDAGVDEQAKARRASDHLPIWVDVAIPDEGPGLPQK